jgi:hypothetical protein
MIAMMAALTSCHPGNGGAQMDSMVDEGANVFQIGIRLMTKNAIADPGIVWQRVQTIFTQFCRSKFNPTSQFVRASAQWMEEAVEPTSLKPHELLVYLVRDRSASLIRVHYKSVWDMEPPGPNVVGLTAVKMGGGNLSEVYYAHDFCDGEPERIANVIVHELMHNKLNMGKDMHDLAPFAGPEGGFIQDTVPLVSNVAMMMGRKLEPTGTDIRTMGPALPRTVRQKAGI